MAQKIELNREPGHSALVRMADPDAARLYELLRRRYPSEEWGTFARFGWRAVGEELLLCLASLDEPLVGDLDERVGLVRINSRYTKRIALEAEKHGLAVGVIHSHPESYAVGPSWIDDDMDSYYAGHFAGFAPDRPYVSLIFAWDRSGRLAASGRVHWRGVWRKVERFYVPGPPATAGSYDEPRVMSAEAHARVARLGSAFGTEAAERLARSTAAVVGASGTGSPAIEALARAGVGRIVVVDPDTFSASNLERVHGSVHDDVGKDQLKVLIAARHVRSINPDCEVVPIAGRVPQPLVVDELVKADVVLGCTDQHHSRVALSDLSVRYLVPTIDCGVNLEGEGGRVSGQAVRLARFLAADPCVYCRRMVDPRRVSQELMSSEERLARARQAQEAERRGEKPDQYWKEMAQLNTVGYLTTAAGSMAAGYAIGLITARFSPRFMTVDLDLSARQMGAVERKPERMDGCTCGRVRGHADQGGADAMITPPTHWGDAAIVA